MKDPVRAELAKLAREFEREARRFRKKARSYRSEQERIEAMARDYEAQQEHELIAGNGEKLDTPFD